MYFITINGCVTKNHCMFSLSPLFHCTCFTIFSCSSEAYASELQENIEINVNRVYNSTFRLDYCAGYEMGSNDGNRWTNLTES